jgi:hypothetical protein
MADANLKFIRVHGRVVPIRADQVGRQKKRVQKTASDVVSRKDAKQSLRSTIKKGVRREKILGTGAIFSSMSALGLLGAMRFNPGLRKVAGAGVVASVGAIGLGALTAVQGQYNAQLRKDASRIGKAKALAGGRVANNYGARKAREYSSIFENRLKENQGLTPSAAPINPMPPQLPPELPPPVPQTLGTTSV